MEFIQSIQGMVIMVQAQYSSFETLLPGLDPSAPGGSDEA